MKLKFQKAQSVQNQTKISKNTESCKKKPKKSK